MASVFQCATGRPDLGERHALVLRTRPPVGEEGEEIARADGAVAVEVGRTASVTAPSAEGRDEVTRSDEPITVEVRKAPPLLASPPRDPETPVEFRALRYGVTSTCTWSILYS